MFAPWRSHNPVRITKCPITGKSFIASRVNPGNEVPLGCPQLMSSSVTSRCILRLSSNTASSTNDMFYSWKADVFIHCLSNNLYYISVNRDQFFRQQKGNGKHKTVPFNKWQEILAGKDLLSKLHFRDLKSSARNEEDERVHRSAVKARGWINTETMRNGFEILAKANFPQMHLWIHDKYSSISFPQRVCRRKMP